MNHDVLDRDVDGLGPTERANTARDLMKACWLWPDPVHDAERFENACKLTERGGPPELLPGQVPLVAVNDARASLWMLHVGAPDAAPVQFGREALACWRTASIALPRVLPVLWKPVHDIASRALRARIICSVNLSSDPTTVRAHTNEQSLDGESFGLSFALAMTSVLLGTPIPSDVVASAAIDADGRVAKVDGLGDKIAVLAQKAPGLRRLLVEHSQCEDARRVAAGTWLQVVGVKSVYQALEIVFPDMERILVAEGADPTRRDELIETLFMLALSARTVVDDWRGIERAALWALDVWPDATEPQRQALRYARATAGRHTRNAGELGMPDEAWLATIPEPHRTQVIAGHVQQAADTGAPDPARIEARALAHLVRGADAFPEHLKLLGAIGRLYVANGREREALACQKEAADGWFVRRMYGELSYPLSEWYRLAGLLEDRDELAAAEAFYRRIEGHPELGNGRDYIELARGRAWVMLRHALDRALKYFEQLHTSRAQAELRMVAARWRVRALDDLGRGDEADAVVAQLRAADGLPESAAERCRIALELIALDRALREGDGAAATEAVDRVLALEPEPSKTILGSSTLERPAWPAYLQNRYPY